MATVSHSEAEAFTSCERKWFYGYAIGIQPKGGNVSDGLYRGAIGHEGLAAYYRAKHEGSSNYLSAGMAAVIANKNLGGRDDPNSVAIFANTVALLQKYHEYWSDRDADLEIVEVESSRLYEINPDLSTQIRPDIIVRRPGFGLECWDHKFQFNFMNDTSLNLLPQLPKYQKGLTDAGLEIRRCNYNQVRYRDLNPDPKLTSDDNYERIFRRTKAPISRERRARTLQEHTIIGRRIKYFRSLPIVDLEKSVIRSANVKNCSWCPFDLVCTNDINGRDNRLMIQEEYEPKTRRELIVESVNV